MGRCFTGLIFSDVSKEHIVFIFKESDVQGIGTSWTPLALNMRIKAKRKVQHIMNHTLLGSVCVCGGGWNFYLSVVYFTVT